MEKQKETNHEQTVFLFLFPGIRLSISPSYNANPYNFAAFSQVILRLSASGTPAKVFSTKSRELGKVEA